MSTQNKQESMAIWTPSYEMPADHANPMTGSIQVSHRDARTPEFQKYLQQRRDIQIIAEGDSWFDLPYDPIFHSLPGGLIHALENTDAFPYNILNFAERGETLDTIAYGTIDDHGRYQPPGMNEVVDAFRHLQPKPKAFLLSAGGNDIAGPEFKMLLNHKSSGRPALRKTVVDYLIHDYIKNTYLDCAKRVWAVSPTTKVFLHGYANAWPTGIGYKVGPFTLAGPWLLPSIWEKTYTRVEGKKIVTDLMNEFALMLKDVAATDARFFVMDFRSYVGNQVEEWHDEMHLQWDAYLKAATYFAKLITDNI